MSQSSLNLKQALMVLLWLRPANMITTLSQMEEALLESIRFLNKLEAISTKSQILKAELLLLFYSSHL